MSLRPNRLGDEYQDGQFFRALKALHRRRGLAATAEVGRLALEHCTAPRSQALELERLASNANCPFSRSALKKAVRVHLACRETPAVLAFAHVGPSHLLATLSLSTSQRSALLQTAETQRLSVRQLRAEVEQLKTESSPDRQLSRDSQNPPKVAGAIRSLKQARRQIESALSDLVDQGVGPTELPALLDAIFALESLCSDLSRRVRQSSITVPPPCISSMVELSPRARQNHLSRALLDAAKELTTRHG